MIKQISHFYGITITMSDECSEEPHIIAEYLGQEAPFSIEEDPLCLGRSLPRRADYLICNWIELHHIELMRLWNSLHGLKQADDDDFKIPPLM